MFNQYIIKFSNNQYDEPIYAFAKVYKTSYDVPVLSVKTCEECRNSLYEYLGNESTTSTIDLFGLKITVSKDILKIIFIILIICIFIILLSMVNVSLKEETNMKYFMMPPQMPYFRPYQ